MTSGRRRAAFGTAGVTSAMLVASVLVAPTLTAAPAFAESGTTSIDGAVISDAPVGEAPVEPTASEIELAPVEAPAEYAEGAAVPEPEGDLQQQSLAEEATTEERATAGAARVDLESDIAVFGVTWQTDDAVPARIDYRELADGVWSDWKTIETEAVGAPAADTGAQPTGSDPIAGSTEPVLVANSEAIEVIAFTAEGQSVADLEIAVIDPRGGSPVENGIEAAADGAAETDAPADPEAEDPAPTEQAPADPEPSEQPEVPGDDEDPAPSEQLRDEPVSEDPDTTAGTASFAGAAAAHPALAVRSASTESAGVQSAVASADVNTGLGLTIKSRKAWGANESWKFGNPAGECTYGTYKCQITYTGAVVHHTAGSNDYTRAQVPEILRGINYFHTFTQNFGDMGYQLLVDKYGGVWEGRYGSLTSSPYGAQAIGANWQTFGISVIGEFTASAPPAAAQDSVAKAIAWMFKKHGIKNPKGTIWIPHADKQGRTVPTIMGHRQTMPTACPGDAFFARLPSVRDNVVRYMNGPAVRPGKLVAPFVDVYDQDKFASEIKWMSDSGITTGTRTMWGLEYQPKASVSREAMAAFIYRAEGASFTGPAVSPFADVQPGDKFYDEITWMHAHGYATGTKQPSGKPKFEPKASVSRSAMAAFLYRRSGESQPLPSSSPFADVKPSDKFYREIVWMRESGISTGNKQPSGKPKYAPGDAVSREAMAAFLYRTQHRVSSSRI